MRKRFKNPRFYLTAPFVFSFAAALYIVALPFFVLYVACKGVCTTLESAHSSIDSTLSRKLMKPINKWLKEGDPK